MQSSYQSGPLAAFRLKLKSLFLSLGCITIKDKKASQPLRVRSERKILSQKSYHRLLCP